MTLDYMYHDLTNRVKNEEIGITADCEFKNSITARQEGQLFFQQNASDIAKRREKIEDSYYQFIKYGLIHIMNEQKDQSNELIFTRRWIFTNLDCISYVQFIIREYGLFVIVQMRSSDLNGALPGDLKFFSSLPDTLLNYLEACKDDDNFSEVGAILQDLRLLPVTLKIQFGSLHVS